MSLRIRPDGRILCAALHPEAEGDVYLHDGIHYHISVEKKLLVTEAEPYHLERGEWWWRECVPKGVVIDSFYL